MRSRGGVGLLCSFRYLKGMGAGDVKLMAAVSCPRLDAFVARCCRWLPAMLALMILLWRARDRATASVSAGDEGGSTLMRLRSGFRMRPRLPSASRPRCGYAAWSLSP
jgi:hypothetical protein